MRMDINGVVGFLRLCSNFVGESVGSEGRETGVGSGVRGQSGVFGLEDGDGDADDGGV